MLQAELSSALFRLAWPLPLLLWDVTSPLGHAQQPVQLLCSHQLHESGLMTKEGFAAHWRWFVDQGTASVVATDISVGMTRLDTAL